MVLYGHEPRHFGVDISQSCQLPDLKTWLHERELMQQPVKQHLLRAQTKMKYQADKRRSFREFQVGDQVYLKAQPYVQTSLAPRSSNKLAFRFFGPFKILERIGSSAYRLRLPVNCSIHPVFHVSQLKQAVPLTATVSPALPDPENELQVPLEILDRRLHQQRDSMIPQVLVRWSNLPIELSSWEDEVALRQEFPRAPAWGQAGFQERGDVTAAGHAVPDKSEEADGKAADETEERSKDEPTGKRAGSRRRTANVRIAGPEWAK
jgi:hypothetical protein